MAKESRSRGGCWTCRARRKKCDESRPHCSLCLSLRIECHGYAKKPGWMDGGAKERAELTSLMRKVAHAIQRRKLGGRRFPAPEAFPPPYSSLPSSLVTKPLERNVRDAVVVAESNNHEIPIKNPTQEITSETAASVDMVDFLPGLFNSPSPTVECT